MERFRLCLHPSPFGFALGILIIAFSMGLWFWLIVQLESPVASKQVRRPPPMARSAAVETSRRAT